MSEKDETIARLTKELTAARLSLKQYQEPALVIQKKWDPSECPRCHRDFSDIEECDDGYWHRAYNLERCPYCGQKLSWNETLHEGLLHMEPEEAALKPHSVSSEDNDCKLYVKTPLGTLVAYASSDPNYPGIYIDLQRNGFNEDAPLALVEYTASEADMKNEECLISRIWKDITEDDYSDRVVHARINDFFSMDRAGEGEKHGEI